MCLEEFGLMQMLPNFQAKDYLVSHIHYENKISKQNDLFGDLYIKENK